MFKQIGTAIALTVILLTSTVTEADAAPLDGEALQYRDCVAHRESRGDVTAQNPRSSAQGKYQFLDNQWRHGLSYMVRKEMKSRGMKPARNLVQLLQNTPIKRWSEFHQDMAFAAVINTGGAHHWRLAGSKCEPLRKAIS
jgi:hypothetical protein